MAAFVTSWGVILFCKEDVIVAKIGFNGSGIKFSACVTIGLISGLFSSGDILSGGGTIILGIF